MEKLRQLKLVDFPIENNEKPLKIVITDKILGRGAFGEVRVGYNKENRTEAYALKIIDKSRLKTKIA